MEPSCSRIIFPSEPEPAASWEACQARFRRTKNDLFADDEIDEPVLAHMSLDYNSPLSTATQQQQQSYFEYYIAAMDQDWSMMIDSARDSTKHYWMIPMPSLQRDHTSCGQQQLPYYQEYLSKKNTKWATSAAAYAADRRCSIEIDSFSSLPVLETTGY